ncbi:Poly(beta-D-mannuronate) C5 epimerase precursor [Pirellulimonas nuda]|uniref:Poly(Beta-D-mannuronate) C5 epimerase n=1 Tax=Pirellulimonas nuda TaxID=2528009 RepID=A0A518DAD1_9BACT|nr:right-handed parallel beta-helix repeat-containing protein [Pirellulimonas nuda]QDU88441.1 Poly(beta-D-mannuronate) C5 epimerase precursor [Pirellulimonas nuda]
MSRRNDSRSFTAAFLFGGIGVALAANCVREARAHSPLLFAIGNPVTNVMFADEPKYSVTILDKAVPAPPAVELPDTARLTAADVRRLAPATGAGSVRVCPAGDLPLLDEAFRSDRGRDLRRRQGAESARAIFIDSGVLTLDQAAEQLADAEVAENNQGVVTLRLPLVVGPGATLIIDGARTPELWMSTDRGAFLANAGGLFLFDAVVTSWSESTKKPTEFVNKKEFRPFISSYVRSKTYAAGCKFMNLGFDAPTAYGFSLSSHPERERGEPRDDWPTGALVDNEFRGLYYGFYSFEARDVAILNNLYQDNIVYGIDPHDRSTRLAIVGNKTIGTLQKHGIIGSRGVSHSFICDNQSFGNAGSGVMLDRQCSHNVVRGNQAYNNGQGIAVYESGSNAVCDNLVAFNKASGVRIRNSDSILVQNNTIVGNGDYALEVYAKRLDDHDARLERGDTYDEQTRVTFLGNRVGGNLGLAKGTDFTVLRLGDVRPVKDLGAIATRLGHTPPKQCDSADAKLGQELSDVAPRISAALKGGNGIVEVRQ